MQTENNVIANVCAHLARGGWSIVNFAHTTESGVDIEAVRNGQRLVIEAKGETSSNPSSSRFGRLFDKGQCIISFSAALLRAIAMQSREPSTISAVALPGNECYMRIGAEARAAMQRIGIPIFWTHPDGSIVLWGTVDLPSKVGQSEAA